ncbi:hypothetical protein RINTHM_11590 [Richelia intracellularis HM01]|uniref:hypothetical protein n=1 Tax=Richelia intracellularis TaxID=1164990 RepID=UPI0002B5DECC|nr:hypothetical protein [Richelia intracellularis]CCH65619.1 hypothetical protein RINTHM_11590 [Richelia intracellularis HM01]
MFDIGWYSTQLLLKGKLLRDPIDFASKTIVTSSIALLILIPLALIKLPLCIPITISSFIAGLIMPFLLKDFKIK